MGNIIKNINLFESVSINPIDSLYFKKYNAFIMEFVKGVDTSRYDRMADALKRIFHFSDRFDTNVRGYRMNCRQGEEFVYIITKYNNGFDWGWDRVSDFKSEHYFNKNLKYPKLFTIDEVDTYDKIVTILERGTVTPNYNPKKIERTLEGVNYRPYRFKTEKEMVDQYGEEWRNHVEDTYFSDEMDYLLGTVLEHPFPDEADEISIPGQDEDTVWWIVRSFLTRKKPDKPHYHPKKIERTLESAGGGYLPLSVYCGNREAILGFEKLLHEWGWEYLNGMKFIMKNHFHGITATTFFDFNDSKKENNIADGRKKTVNPQFEYPKDLGVIMKYFKKAPSYDPRRTERTLERLKGPRYHIKTEQEFMNEFGDNWREGVRLRWVDSMDCFYGKDIDITIKDEDKYKGNDKVLISMSGWNFSWDMIAENKPEIPNYNPKKIERTLESFENNKKTYYNTHGHYAPYSEIKELEEDERENYPEGTFDEWKMKYDISDDDLAIWVTKDKRDVYHYLTSAENWDDMYSMTEDEIKKFLKKHEEIDVDDIILEVNDDGFIIEESDDGDGGFLFVKK